MHRLGAKALVWGALGLVAAGAVGGTGCKGTQPTELIPGISSQMVVPKDLVAVSVQVQANGSQVFCRGYQVSPTTHVVDLPSTLGVLPAQSPDTVVTITIRGYDDASTSGDWDDCSVKVDDAANSDGVTPPRILRRSTQTYVASHELFLPMPLSYSCIDKDCSSAGANFTCKGNQCVDPATDTSTLPDFDPTLIDGTGLCFSPMQCFIPGATFPAAAIDATQCIYSLPSYVTATAVTSGVNVKVNYQDWKWQPNAKVTGMPYEQVVANAGEEEILNEDPTNCDEPVPAGQKPNPTCEGFKVLPPEADAGVTVEAQATLPGDSGLASTLPYNPHALRIQLAKGLCDLVQAGITPPAPPATMTATYHTISDISISGVCQPKLPLLPICAEERNNNPVLADAGTTGDGVCNVGVPLNPAPSILYLVMDQTSVMHGALGPGGSVTTLALSFQDPVFKRTYSGFQYMANNDQGATCTSATTPYTVPIVPACSGAGNCALNAINSIQGDVAKALSAWTPPATEITAAADGGTITCYADVDCVGLNAGSYCSKPNPPVPEGGLDAGFALDAGGDDGGDDGGEFTPGVCTNPQALDLAGAMRPTVGAYAEVTGYAMGLPATAVAGVMFFVNRIPETALGTPAGPVILDGGAADGGGGAEAGIVDGGSGIPAIASPVAALDCPTAPPGVSISVGTPGDQATLPAEALAEQQILESEMMNAFTTNGLQTYIVVLDSDAHDPRTIQFYNQMQTDLTQPNGVQPLIVLDTTNVSAHTTNAAAAGQELINFSTIITKLGTCLYEIPQTENLSSTTDPSTVKIQYSTFIPPGGPPLPPGSNPPVTIPVDTNCNQAAALAAGDAGGGPNGWNFDANRIRVCGAACDALRVQVGNAAKYGVATGKPTPDVPITVTPLCSGTSGSSDATTGGGG